MEKQKITVYLTEQILSKLTQHREETGENQSEIITRYIRDGLVRELGNEDDEILSCEEVATMLKIHYSQITRMAKNGEIKATKIAGKWRFSRKNIKKLFEK